MAASSTREIKLPDTVYTLLCGWLIFTQLIVLASVVSWIEFGIFNEAAALIPGLTSQHNPFVLIFCIYPAFPISLSVLAWIGLWTRRYMLAFLSGTLPVIPAILLLIWIITMRLGRS